MMNTISTDILKMIIPFIEKKSRYNFCLTSKKINKECIISDDFTYHNITSLIYNNLYCDPMTELQIINKLKNKKCVVFNYTSPFNLIYNKYITMLSTSFLFYESLVSFENLQYLYIIWDRVANKSENVYDKYPPKLEYLMITHAYDVTIKNLPSSLKTLIIHGLSDNHTLTIDLIPESLINLEIRGFLPLNPFYPFNGLCDFENYQMESLVIKNKFILSSLPKSLKKLSLQGESRAITSLNDMVNLRDFNINLMYYTREIFNTMPQTIEKLSISGISRHKFLCSADELLPGVVSKGIYILPSGLKMLKIHEEDFYGYPDRQLNDEDDDISEDGTDYNARYANPDCYSECLKIILPKNLEHFKISMNFITFKSIYDVMPYYTDDQFLERRIKLYPKINFNLFFPETLKELFLENIFPNQITLPSQVNKLYIETSDFDNGIDLPLSLETIIIDNSFDVHQLTNRLINLKNVILINDFEQEYHFLEEFVKNVYYDYEYMLSE